MLDFQKQQKIICLLSINSITIIKFHLCTGNSKLNNYFIYLFHIIQ